MDSWKAVRAQLLRQQRWVKCAAVAALGVTAVALLLSFVGTESSQIRSSGLVAFDAADKSTSSLIARHVVKLKEARDKLVSNFWTWDSPFDEVEDEMRGAYGQEPGQPGSWRDPGGYWDDDNQVWVPTASSGYWDEHTQAWVQPAQAWEAPAWNPDVGNDQASWQVAVPGGEEPQWQQPPEAQQQGVGQAEDAPEWQLPAAETQAEAWGDDGWVEPTAQWDGVVGGGVSEAAASAAEPQGEEAVALVVDPDSWDQEPGDTASAVWDGADDAWPAGEEEWQEAPQEVTAEPGAQVWQEEAGSAEVWPAPEGASQQWQQQEGWVEPQGADLSQGPEDQLEWDGDEPTASVYSALE